MDKSKSQSGSAHFIVIIVLVIALLGTLGFVYWQNFMQPKAAEITNNVDIESSAIETPKNTDVTLPSSELTEITSDQSFGTKLAIKYPKSWKYTQQLNEPFELFNSPSIQSNTTITSPDEAISVYFLVDNSMFFGEYACKNGSGSTLKLEQLSTETIPDYPGYRLALFVESQTLTSTEDKVYIYHAYVQPDSEAVRVVNVGDTTCGFSNQTTFGNGNETVSEGGLATTSKAMLFIALNNVENGDNATLDSFNEAIMSDNFKIAKQIVQSLYEKE